MKTPQPTTNLGLVLQRLILWSVVILYTACLPDAILVYRSLVSRFSSQLAGKVPLFTIIALATAYIIAGLLKKMTVRCLIVLAVGGIIITLIMNFEANANKHIHIPEYILMSWILYLALAVDYSGSGILLLVFICGSMLGVVDEILQGIHPQRTFGWTDMLVDTAASLIGCLTIMGLRQTTQGDWNWCKHLRHFKGALAVIFFGAIMALPMGSFLLHIPAKSGFSEAYPGWLLVGNGLFVTACMALMVYHWRRRLIFGISRPPDKPCACRKHSTAWLWIMCPLAILLAMHALVLWVAVAGVDFQ